jgi:hypothetical protein
VDCGVVRFPVVREQFGEPMQGTMRESTSRNHVKDATRHRLQVALNLINTGARPSDPKLEQGGCVRRVAGAQATNRASIFRCKIPFALPHPRSISDPLSQLRRRTCATRRVCRECGESVTRIEGEFRATTPVTISYHISGRPTPTRWALNRQTICVDHVLERWEAIPGVERLETPSAYSSVALARS